MQVQFSQVAVPLLSSTAELGKSVEARFDSENKRIVRWHVASVDKDAQLANCEVVWMPLLSSQVTEVAWLVAAVVVIAIVCKYTCALLLASTVKLR
jgi:hypothetical protein